MAKVNNFIINSDYSSLALADSRTFTVTVPAITITQNGYSPQREYTFDLPLQSNTEYFEQCSIYSSYWDFAQNTTWADFYVDYPGENIQIGQSIRLTRTSGQKYTLSVRTYWMPLDVPYSESFSKTIPQSTVIVKLNMLVPTD